MTRLSLPNRSIRSASTVRGWLRSSFALAPPAEGAWAGTSAGVARPRARARWPVRAWPGTSSPRVPRERGAHAPGHRRPLVPHAHVERGPVHHRAVAGEADGRVGPEPPLGALPPEHARLELQPVAGGQHHVPPDLYVARLLEQVPFFTHDRPR